LLNHRYIYILLLVICVKYIHIKSWLLWNWCTWLSLRLIIHHILWWHHSWVLSHHRILTRRHFTWGHSVQVLHLYLWAWRWYHLSPRWLFIHILWSSHHIILWLHLLKHRLTLFILRRHSLRWNFLWLIRRWHLLLIRWLLYLRLLLIFLLIIIRWITRTTFIMF
jgi:hypothetical protein